jgi:hypothetical protein
MDVVSKRTVLNGSGQPALSHKEQFYMVQMKALGNLDALYPHPTKWAMLQV